MALRGRFKNLKNDAGALISAAALTTTDYSETLSLGGLASFGVMIDCGTVAHQTSGTLNITPQFSYDSGTSWVANPIVGYDSGIVDPETSATVYMGVAEIAETDGSNDRIHYWRNPFPSDADVRLRFALTVAGAGTHSFTLTAVKFFGRTEV